MTLKQQNFILIAVASVVMILALTVNSIAVNQVENQTSKMLAAENTVKGLSQLRFLLMETSLYHEPRSMAQWRERVSSLRSQLATQSYNEADQSTLVAKEQENLNVIARLYDRLIVTDFRVEGMKSELGSHIVNELFVGTEEMLDDAFELMRLSRIRVEAAQSEARNAMLLSLATMAILIICIWLIVRQRILRPIAAVQRGTEQVGAGNLAFRINLHTRNEIGVLATAFDSMTSRLEGAQKALAQATTDLRTVIDNMPALVVYWDQNLLNRFANSAYLPWFGRTPEEIRGLPMREVIGEDRYQAIEPGINSVLRGNTEIFENTIECANGETRHALFSYVPDFEDGKVKGFYGIISDVTALKQAQLERMAALEQLQSVIDAASELSIIAIGLDGKIRLFSHGSEKMLGYPAQEIVNQASPMILHDAEEIIDRGRQLTQEFKRPIYGVEVLTEPVRSGHTETRQWTYICKDGDRIPVNLTMTAIRDMQGEITGFLATAQDITQELILRSTLSEARDLAEAANHAKSDFLANMSHEIRTPMNAILGMLQLLQQTPLEERQLDYASKAESAAKALLGILNDILDFSKVEAGKLVLDPQPFSIDKLLSDVATILTTAVGDKDVEVLFEIDTNLTDWVIGDSMRIQQVLINLAGNAIKFTERGEIALSARLILHGDELPSLAFAIRDTGIGISPEQCQRIFDGFSQAEASTARRYGGTGLGLAISQRLVRLMGGNLSVESELGVGSTFRFSIPCEATTGPTHPQSANIVQLQNLRCLIIDDNRTARQVISVMLNSFGWDVTQASSGEEALSILDDERANTEKRYDVIFVDWRMPGLDGWATCKRLRKLPGAQHASLIMMVTARGHEMVAQRCVLESNILDGFLIKPIAASMLFDAVADVRMRRTHHPAKHVLPPPQQRLQGLRLLIVEDNLVNQQVAYELLSHEGAIVEVADCGTAGIAAVQHTTRAFDAVLMDIQMPDMDGYAATQHIRKHLQQQHLPIIAMTANAMKTDRDAALAAGMNDHIGKPFDLSQLVAIILKHTGGTAAAPAAPAFMPATVTPQAISDDPTGFNTGAALARLGGKTEVYVMVLNAFIQEAGKIIETLPIAAFADEKSEAIRISHTLKGLAGTIGAEYLAEIALKLESTLKAAVANAADPHAISKDLDMLKETCLQTMMDAQNIAKNFNAGEPDGEASEVKKTDDAAEATSNHASRRGRLLIVDHQPANIIALHKILSVDYDIFMTKSGEQAIAYCLNTPPDLILTDSMTRGMSGLELCQKLKQQPETMHIPVIMVTDNPLMKDEIASWDDGGIDFVNKPINPVAIRDRVRTHLQAKLQPETQAL